MCDRAHRGDDQATRGAPVMGPQTDRSSIRDSSSIERPQGRSADRFRPAAARVRRDAGPVRSPMTRDLPGESLRRGTSKRFTSGCVAAPGSDSPPASAEGKEEPQERRRPRPVDEARMKRLPAGDRAGRRRWQHPLRNAGDERRGRRRGEKRVRTTDAGLRRTSAEAHHRSRETPAAMR